MHAANEPLTLSPTTLRAAVRAAILDMPDGEFTLADVEAIQAQLAPNYPPLAKVTGRIDACFKGCAIGEVWNSSPQAIIGECVTILWRDRTFCAAMTAAQRGRSCPYRQGTEHGKIR
jgi:hypothetical protein